MSFEPLLEGNAVNTGVPYLKVPMHRKLGYGLGPTDSGGIALHTVMDGGLLWSRGRYSPRSLSSASGASARRVVAVPRGHPAVLRSRQRRRPEEGNLWHYPAHGTGRRAFPRTALASSRTAWPSPHRMTTAVSARVVGMGIHLRKVEEVLLQKLSEDESVPSTAAYTTSPNTCAMTRF